MLPFFLLYILFSFTLLPILLVPPSSSQHNLTGDGIPTGCRAVSVLRRGEFDGWTVGGEFGLRREGLIGIRIWPAEGKF